jgi:hypothetical protein
MQIEHYKSISDYLVSERVLRITKKLMGVTYLRKCVTNISRQS